MPSIYEMASRQRRLAPNQSLMLRKSHAHAPPTEFPPQYTGRTAGDTFTGALLSPEPAPS